MSCAIFRQLASLVPVVAALLAACAADPAAALDISKFEPFVATPPYNVMVQGSPREVSIGGVSRYFDFSGDKPFINRATGKADVATFNAAFGSGATISARVFSGDAITDDGVPGRIEKSGGLTLVAYKAGDPPVAGRCRSQLSSFPVPSRQRMVWDLEFRLGADSAGLRWPITVPGQHPVLLWQLKAPDFQPSLTMSVDSDPNSPGDLLLKFGRASGRAANVIRVGEVNGIRRHEFVTVLIDAVLDEREVSAGGNGYWRVWVNGSLVVDTFGPTLTFNAIEPHQWFLSTYLYNDLVPLPETRAVYWRKARMLSNPQ